jgi:hypothetical protein
MKQRVLVVTLSVVALLALGVIVVFAFGTPQAPEGFTPVTDASTSIPPMGEAAMAEESPVATGEVPAPDPNSPLALEIPGCVCHSDDPQLVEDHASYRMNQCFGCHAGGMPEMGQ